MRHVLLVLFIVGCNQYLLGQGGSILDKFTVSITKDEVLLNWIISSGNTCNGIDIMRSTDSLNFEEIGDIEGICGDEEKAVSYTFVDKNPKRNTLNFYRLELGSVGSSEIVSVYNAFIDDAGFSIRPNPVISRSTIYYSNDNGFIHDLSIFDLNGALIKTLSTNEDRIEFNVQGLNSGLYLFTLKSQTGSLNTVGKFVVVN